MELISPPTLKKGYTVGIIAPARKVVKEEIEPALTMLNDWGLNVKLGTHIFGEYNQFSGTDTERASDFKQMVEDPSIKAILCARGGYGTVRLLDHINLRALQREPKWIIGFSDVTVLHSILNAWFKVETIHGIMAINFPSDGLPNLSTESLRRVLFGEPQVYRINYHKFNRLGQCKGELCGGNLSILASIAGTDADISTNGKILFIEDLDEYLYHIDRMMMNLKRSGKLKDLAGLIVGGMTDMNDNTIPFGRSAYQIIHEAVAEYNYPVCFDFPAGHQKDNVALIMGRIAELNIKQNGSCLAFSPANCKI
jgi:muramoyltetrapeptide carboxypeptidase